MTTAPLARDFSATARLGVVLAIVSAVGYGTMITATRLSYDDGSNPLTLICARAAVPPAILAQLMLGRGSAVALLPRAVWPVGAVAYIPVSLAALVFYAYPVLVAGLLPLIGRGRVGWTAALAFLAAFAGLALALAPSFAVLDPLGLALAVGAALSGAALMLAADRLPPAQDMLAVGLYMNLAALAVAAPYALITGGLAAPVTAVGWGAIAYVCLGFLGAFLAMIGAVRYAGALRTALVFNVEPVVAIASAVLLLGETLSSAQVLGVGLVFAALTLATLAERPSPPLPPPGA
jgi:drug/metabolite transporter (DMT)-like permease